MFCQVKFELVQLIARRLVLAMGAIRIGRPRRRETGRGFLAPALRARSPSRRLGLRRGEGRLKKAFELLTDRSAGVFVVRVRWVAGALKVRSLVV